MTDERLKRVTGVLWGVTAGVLAVGFAAAAARAGTADLLPTPKSITLATGQMPLTAESRIVAADASLVPLGNILSKEIWLITTLPLVVATGEARPGDIVLKIDPAIRAEADIVAVQKKDGKQKVGATRDFAHTIEVADKALVTGWDYRAVCEGTATILQALDVKEGKVSLPKMSIKDWPHADYTGTMIDAARQWIPPDAIKYTIEACRFWKVRYVQMHFSDDHAYTFGSKIFPTLGKHNQRISEGIIARCYTQEEMRDLEAYAVARGVTIVPELETPGHSGAMARSRPDLFAGPGCMPMASEKLYVALDKLVGEMCGIFKASPYFHIGCDECNFGGVGNSAADKEYMKAHTLPEDTHPLQDAWQVYIMHVIRMKEICHKYGKMPIAWEGMPADKRIKDGIVIMTWYSANCAREVEQQGWAVITVPWFTGPIQTWNIFYANDHIYQRTTNVLGAQRPMWQMSEYSLHESYVPGLCERQERTWGPDNDWGEEAQYRARMARSQARMSQVAAPVRPVFEGARILGISDGLKGWVAYSGAMKLSLTTPKLPGTQIHYTLDGADPTPRSPVYTGPLLMQKDFRLNAALFHDGRMLAPATRMKYEWRDVSGWITEYMISGPYMKDNLPGNKLFDIPFDPETPGKGEWTAWKGQGTSPWTCDLTPKGDNRCAYMRAQVWSPKAQNAQLQVASDDGAKVWLNDKVVLQNNKVQSYTDPPHRVAVALKQGWNTLLLKITQDKDGWGAMARVVAADGNKLDGLKFKAE